MENPVDKVIKALQKFRDEACIGLYPSPVDERLSKEEFIRLGPLIHKHDGELFGWIYETNPRQVEHLLTPRFG